MPDIDNSVALTFCNETLRPLADMLAGLIIVPAEIIATVKGKGLSTILGTDDITLLRQQAWTTDDYKAVSFGEVIGSDSGGRTLCSNIDMLAILRVAIALDEMINADSNLKPLIAKWAVNPKPNKLV